MPTLRIDLQDGFSDDTVVIRVNARVVFDKRHVRTRLQIGLADSCEVELPDASADVTVTLPEKGITGSVRSPITEATFLGVSIDRSGGVAFRQSSEQFGYF